jgi:hypothetical protein
MFIKQLLKLACAALFAPVVVSAGDLNLGPFYDLFPLTLSSGTRTEVAGPFYYHEREEEQEIVAFPPLFSHTQMPGVDAEEFDFLYPFVSLDRFGSEYRFHVMQVFSFAGGQTQEETDKRRFTLFPFYFQQRSVNPEFNYTAFLPFYGTLRNRLFRDEIHFVMFPFYVQTRKKDIVTDNYVYPFFHLRHGNALDGWQLFPIVGKEHKGATTRTNSLEEIEIIGGHEKLFVLWPFFFKDQAGLGTDNPSRTLTVLPLFTISRSPKRDSATYFWPFGVTVTDDREHQYRELGAPWPLIVFARGEGKRTSRVWPLYSRAATASAESRFYLWPVYKFNRVHSETFERHRTRIMLYLYSDVLEKNLQTGDARIRRDFWPFYTYKRDLDGRERLQILAPLEPILPNNKSIERNYSPLWSFWRWEKNPLTRSSSRSLLWNLYRSDRQGDVKKSTFFFGFLQFRKDETGRRWRWFQPPADKDRTLSAVKRDGNIREPRAGF